MHLEEDIMDALYTISLPSKNAEKYIKFLESFIYLIVPSHWIFFIKQQVKLKNI